MKNMATITSFLLLISFSVFNVACKKDTATICENLFEQGIADTISLKGDWKFKNFAKTINGDKISNKETISSDYWIGFENNNIKGGICNDLWGNFSVSDNNQISISINSITFKLCDNETNEMESKLLEALNNSECFVIRNNELLIHYTGDKNKNILLLTKK